MLSSCFLPKDVDPEVGRQRGQEPPACKEWMRGHWHAQGVCGPRLLAMLSDGPLSKGHPSQRDSGAAHMFNGQSGEAAPHRQDALSSCRGCKDMRCALGLQSFCQRRCRSEALSKQRPDRGRAMALVGDGVTWWKPRRFWDCFAARSRQTFSQPWIPLGTAFAQGRMPITWKLGSDPARAGNRPSHPNGFAL